ncbi:hypothetical protein LGL08_20165 [Clostridium estertheticum]|uniref:hypothetical protein n=1 Tax=Clostridium estertheticum TaxID=238834 RepID=UPI001CF145B9|nr:hypothetical protein [Clostridium estertheticum]MCB2309021.1 hypothetical protein [Clostridium estertheticum]MCB2346845.1 hypothetical protein [Clostridium estertheticum]MCB2351843.1 hypothetical protein [Clostridium estertheticum]WAG48446.1 hypothetical protein LL127_22970 [Clostridium estertheticum]
MNKKWFKCKCGCKLAIVNDEKKFEGIRVICHKCKREVEITNQKSPEVRTQVAINLVRGQSSEVIQMKEWFKCKCGCKIATVDDSKKFEDVHIICHKCKREVEITNKKEPRSQNPSCY